MWPNALRHWPNALITVSPDANLGVTSESKNSCQSCSEIAVAWGRVGACRLDFEIPSGTAGVADSAGEGFPDWWEDANGYGEWDPPDAAKDP